MYSFYGGKSGISYDIRAHFDSVVDMCKAFAKGGAYTDVNYGEYVLIDTIINRHAKSDPQNGLLYRRGFEYTQAIDENMPEQKDFKLPNGDPDVDSFRAAFSAWAIKPGAGAEYVGQIVGPQGETPHMELMPESTVRGMEDVYKGTGDMDVVPGAVFDEDGRTILEHNDKMTYTYCNLRDEYGNIVGCVIGFTTPYHVFSFHANSVSPYFGEQDGSDGHWDFSGEELITKTDGNTDEHPYHSIWDIKIPRGVHGRDFKSLEVDTDDRYEIYYRVQDYTTQEEGVEHRIDLGHRLKYIQSIYFDPDTSVYTIYFTTGETYAVTARFIHDIYIDGNQQPHVVYTDRDDTTGERIDEKIGEPLDYISNIHYDDDGTVWVDFRLGKSIDLKRKFQVIDRIYVNSDNKMVVEYNTLNADGTHQSDVIDYVLKTIESAYVDPDTQELVVKYRVKSTGVDADDFVIESISDPLNTIAATALDDRYHLLVYYSSSIIRGALVNKATWDGKNDWCDLGYVRGESGGIHIIGNLPYTTDLPAGGPPAAYKGWVYTVTTYDAVTGDPDLVTMYAYDYENPTTGLNGWYPIGSIDSSVLTPDTIIMISPRSATDPNMPAENSLSEGGIWFVVTR